MINKDLGVQPSPEFNIVACKATVTEAFSAPKVSTFLTGNVFEFVKQAGLGSVVASKVYYSDPINVDCSYTAVSFANMDNTDSLMS